MLPAWRRIAPVVVAVLLLLNLIVAITAGGRGRWVIVALLALVLAFAIWRRRAEP